MPGQKRVLYLECLLQVHDSAPVQASRCFTQSLRYTPLSCFLLSAALQLLSQLQHMTHALTRTCIGAAATRHSPTGVPLGSCAVYEALDEDCAFSQAKRRALFAFLACLWLDSIGCVLLCCLWYLCRSLQCQGACLLYKVTGLWKTQTARMQPHTATQLTPRSATMPPTRQTQMQRLKERPCCTATQTMHAAASTIHSSACCGLLHACWVAPDVCCVSGACPASRLIAQQSHADICCDKTWMVHRHTWVLTSAKVSVKEASRASAASALQAAARAAAAALAAAREGSCSASAASDSVRFRSARAFCTRRTGESSILAC